eukprot:870031-Prymnesium_polylepis.1
MTGAGAGFSLSAPTATVILEGMDGMGGLSGWRWLLIVQAAPALLVAPLLASRLPDQPSDLIFLSPSDRESLAAVVTPAGSALRPMRTALRETVRRDATWLCAMLCFGFQVCHARSLGERAPPLSALCQLRAVPLCNPGARLSASRSASSRLCWRCRRSPLPAITYTSGRLASSACRHSLL